MKYLMWLGIIAIIFYTFVEFRKIDVQKHIDNNRIFQICIEQIELSDPCKKILEERKEWK